MISVEKAVLRQNTMKFAFLTGITLFIKLNIAGPGLPERGVDNESI